MREPQLERADGAAAGHERYRYERAWSSVQGGQCRIPGAPLDARFEVDGHRVPGRLPERTRFRRRADQTGVAVGGQHLEGAAVAREECDGTHARLHCLRHVAYDDASHLRRTQHRAKRQVQRVNACGPRGGPLNTPSRGEEKRDESAYQNSGCEIRRQVTPVSRW